MTTVVAEYQKKKFSDRELFATLSRYIAPHKKHFVGLMIALALNTALAISAPVFFSYIIDAIETGLASKSLPTNIQFAIAAYVVFSIVGWFLAAIQFTLIISFNARLTRDLRNDAFSNVLNNNVLYFDNEKSGDITSRIVNDTNELFDSGRDIAWVIMNMFRLVATIAVLFYFSFYITIASLAFLPIILVLAVILGKFERRVSAIWRGRLGEVNQRFSEIMAKIQISKAFNREEENLKRFKTINEATYKSAVKRAFAIFIFWPMTDVFKHSLLIIVIFVGTWEVENRDLPIATFILFILLLNYYYWPMVSLANNYHRFQGAFASLERISNIAFDENLKEEDTGTIITDSFKGEIEFKDLGFGYIPETPILHNLDFKILPGQRVAIVGHTGAGKSTIASLLMRFYTPQTGQILIDGRPIENYKLSTLRSNINLVSQRILLFKGTIRENLRISKTDATEEELWSALESVQAREFIELLPDKLSTVIQENGKNLSVGQRQMISFARAILSNPSIIILDEATASVDLYTEAKIQDAIEVLLNNRTSISIAHRLTTILKSDHIIVLEQGNLIEQGTHEELLEKRGLYADMYKLYLETQSAKYLDKIKTVKMH